MIKTISESVRYIGVDDLDLDLFESQYVVPEGMAYNSYVILDEKVAVMDTVQHMEPDHSGLIAEAMARYPGLTLVASAKALQMLSAFTGQDYAGRTLAVKEGETLPLGTHTLRFLMAPMVHWPEVMMSYDLTDKILHALYRAVGLKTPGQGIAFSLPVDQVVGLSTLSLEKSGEAPAGDGDADKS